jgi:hypothetical protein
MEAANFPLISIVIISFNQAGYLEPGALHKVGRYFLEHPETDVLSGAAVYVHENQPDLNYIKRCSVDDLDVLPALNNLVQPSCYFRRSLLQGETPVRVDLHYTMDWELWCQFLERKAKWSFTDEVLSAYRVTGANKAFVGRRKILKEMFSIYRRYCGELVPLTFWFRCFFIPLNKRSNVPNRTTSSKICGRLALLFFRVLNRLYSPSRLRGLETAFQLYDC